MKRHPSRLGTSLPHRRSARSFAAHSPLHRPRTRPNPWVDLKPDPTITPEMIGRVDRLQTTYCWDGPNKGKPVLSFRGGTLLRRALVLQASGGAIIESVRVTAEKTRMSASTVTREYRDWRTIGLLCETKIRSRGRSDTGNWKGSYGAERHLDTDHWWMRVLRKEIDQTPQAQQTIENEQLKDECDIRTYGQNEQMPLRGSLDIGIYETPHSIATTAELPAPTQKHTEIENQENPTQKPRQENSKNQKTQLQTPHSAWLADVFAYWKIQWTPAQMVLLCTLAAIWPGMMKALTSLLAWTAKQPELPRICHASLVLTQLGKMRKGEDRLRAIRADRARRRLAAAGKVAAVQRAHDARKREECSRPRPSPAAPMRSGLQRPTVELARLLTRI